MRSAVAIAAFAAGAFAVPYKRDIVTDVEMVYETDVVTVYATGAPPAYTAAPSPDAQAKHYGHHGGWSRSQEVPAETTIAAPVAPTSATIETPVYVAPITTETPIYVAPTTIETPVYTAPTTTETPVYVAPTTTETPAYIAPTTTEAPAWSFPSLKLPSWNAPSSALTPVASPTSYSGSYADKVVATHNELRSHHNAPAVTWDQGLADIASAHASKCVYEHYVDDSKWGQNIATGKSADYIEDTIFSQWYSKEEQDYAAGDFFQREPTTSYEIWGHFTQVVWKKTTNVGCATMDCTGQQLRDSAGNVMANVPPYFTVCNYDSPGNFKGEFGANVDGKNATVSSY